MLQYWRNKQRKPEQVIFSPQSCKKIVYEAKGFPHRIKSVNLTGIGEPLTNKNLPELVKIIKDADIADKVLFITNGALLTPDLSLRLIDSGLDEIRFSLQGLNSEKYKDVTDVEVDFDSIVKNIRFLYEHKGKCKIYVKIADISLDGCEKLFYEIFGDICDQIYIEKIVPLFKGLDYGFLPESGVKNNIFGEQITGSRICAICFYSIGVAPDGSVLPCCNLYEPPIGDANIENIVDIWNGDKRKAMLLRQLNGEFDPNCKDCFVPNNQQPTDYLNEYAEEIIKRM